MQIPTGYFPTGPNVTLLQAASESSGGEQLYVYNNITHLLRCTVDHPESEGTSPCNPRNASVFQCKEGHVGRLCGACSLGYYPVATRCVACPNPAVAILTLASIYFSVLAFVIVLRFIRRGGKQLRLITSCALFYIQLVNVMCMKNGVRWPVDFVGFSLFFLAWAADVEYLSCAVGRRSYEVASTSILLSLTIVAIVALTLTTFTTILFSLLQWQDADDVHGVIDKSIAPLRASKESSEATTSASGSGEQATKDVVPNDDDDDTTRGRAAAHALPSAPETSQFSCPKPVNVTSNPLSEQSPEVESAGRERSSAYLLPPKQETSLGAVGPSEDATARLAPPLRCDTSPSKTSSSGTDVENALIPRLRRSILRAAMTSLRFFYLPLTVRSLQVYLCTSHDPGTGKRYLQYLPDFECNLDYTIYAKLFASSTISFSLFTVLFPCFLCVAVGIVRQVAPVEERRRLPLWDVLFASFRPGSEWYLPWLFGRSLLLALIFGLVPRASGAALSTLVAWFIVGIVIQIRYQPFASRLENVMEALGLISLAVTTVLGLAYTAEQTTETLELKRSKGGVVVTLHVVQGVYIVAAAWIALLASGCLGSAMATRLPWYSWIVGMEDDAVLSRSGVSIESGSQPSLEAHHQPHHRPTSTGTEEEPKVKHRRSSGSKQSRRVFPSPVELTTTDVTVADPVAAVQSWLNNGECVLFQAMQSRRVATDDTLRNKLERVRRSLMLETISMSSEVVGSGAEVLVDVGLSPDHGARPTDAVPPLPCALDGESPEDRTATYHGGHS